MISKVYTRTGDAGKTSLVSGTRVDKDDVRVEAYGTVDELNSNIGVLMHSTKLDYPEIIALLRKAQNKLFNIGGYLANDKADALYGLKKEDVEELEQMMDKMNEEVPPRTGLRPAWRFASVGNRRPLPHRHPSCRAPRGDPCQGRRC